MKVAITGANGFVGKNLLKRIEELSMTALAMVRAGKTDQLTCQFTGSYDNEFLLDQNSSLQGVDAIVHLAARVHVMHDTSTDPMAEFRKVNVEGTLNLARQAAQAGVRRFVFISSVKVNGESTAPGKTFRPDDIPAPVDPYGISKWEAEQGLRKIAEETGMEVAVIRPPLVYGPGVKGNFQTMIKWVQRGVPLPLGAVHNLRTLVGLDNLVDLIITCLEHPVAANQTFLAGDAEDVSTTRLLRLVGQALGTPARLIPVPPALLKAGASLLGKGDLAQRLLGNLQVDTSKARDLLGWTAPVSLEEGIHKIIVSKGE